MEKVTKKVASGIGAIKRISRHLVFRATFLLRYHAFVVRINKDDLFMFNHKCGCHKNRLKDFGLGDSILILKITPQDFVCI